VTVTLGVAAVLVALASAGAPGAPGAAPEAPAADAGRWTTGTPGGDFAPEAAVTTLVDLRPRALISSFLYQGAFIRPSSVFCDPRTGEVFVVDGGQETIGIFDHRGLPLFAFSDREHLRQPKMIRVDRSGRMFVLDADTTRLKVFNYRGEYLTDVDVAAAAKRTVIVTAFSVDDQDNVYVGDSERGEVLVLNHRWQVAERFGNGGTGPGEFTSIASIFVAPERVYVADAVGYGVQVFTRHGRLIFAFGIHDIGRKNVSLPAGIAADAAGRILLTDTLRQEIKVADAEGDLIGVWGGIGKKPGQVAYPVDLTVGRDGMVCVAEKGNRRVQIFEPVEGLPGEAPPVEAAPIQRPSMQLR
jgi:hypothetical protein